MITVIMPIYNVEKYIEESIESVLNQDYKDFELICIDDGSTDSSGIIADRYAIDERIRVIHKTNSGYGDSMNIGLSMARGEYIYIVEPDDYIDDDTFSEILKIYKKFPELDFVKCDYYAFYGKGKGGKTSHITIKKEREYYEHVLDGPDFFTLFEGRVAHWSAMYKREFIESNSIRFNPTPGAAYQDTGFWFQTIVFARKVYLSGMAHHHYRLDNPCSSVNSTGKVYCINEEYDYIEGIVCSHKDRYMLLPYYCKCRLISAVVNYNRIDEIHRKNYLIRLCDDFNRINDLKLLDTSLLIDKEKKLLNKIMTNPKDLWNIKKKEYDKLRNSIEKVERFFIYGAGEVAQFIYRMLSAHEKDKLKAFVVTKKDEESIDYIANKRVLLFSEYALLSEKDDLFIVGVSDEYENEIVKILEEGGFFNYLKFSGRLL